MSFFGIVLTSIVTLMQLYVSFRFYPLPIRKRFISGKGLIIASVLLWVLFYISRVYGGHDSTLEIILEFAGMHWMGSIFLIAAGFFIADIITAFGLLFKKHLPAIRTAGLITGLILVLTAHIQGIRNPVINSVDISINGLSDELHGLKIAVIADIHGGEMLIGPAWIENIRERLDILQPDMIVFAGDIFERASRPEEMIPVMKKFSAPLGVYAVRGNHDSRRAGRRDVFAEIMEGAGTDILENRWVSVSDKLVIAGINDLTTARRHNVSGAYMVKNALEGIPDSTVILLSHTPWLTGLIAEHEVDLMISGHTHGGQIWPFNYLVQTIYPYVEGLYTIGDMKLYVSRGSGTWGPRMRLWKPGEITILNLTENIPLPRQ